VHLSWPLTGRSAELRLVNGALSGSDPAGIVVGGAAGVGKSRIAREGLAAAASRGCETRWAVGTASARALPLGAFAKWAGSADMDTLQLVRGVIESLTSAPRGTPVVVGVDDAHLLDDLSTFVLHQIVQRRAAKVLLTIRNGEPISLGLQEIWTEGQIERLDLQPLSRDETTMLVSARLGGSLDPDAARRLWTLTQGNVLYLVNIVEQEIGAGRLAQQHGYWRWIGEPVVSPGLVELIESRIGDLPSAVGDVVDALAVGEPLDLALLSRISDPDAVEDAERRGLITFDHTINGLEARLAHPVYGEVRRRRAASVRLRRLRGLVAAELAVSDGGDDTRVVVRRAALSLDSDLKPDPDLLVRAAQGAVWLADLPLAARLGGAAIRAGGGVEASVVRSHALVWLSRGHEANAILADIPPSELSADDHARVALLRATTMLWTLADPTGAKKLIDDASHAIPPSSRGCIDAFLAVYWAAMGRPEDARKSSQHLVLDQLPALAGAATAWAIVVAAGDAGRTTEAIAAADAGYTVAARSFDAAYMGFPIADAHIGALVLSGRIREASLAAERVHRQATDLPGAAQLFSNGVSGRAALGAGRLDNACSLLAPVVELLSASGESNGVAYFYQLQHTIALAMRGLRDEAADALAALEKLRHPSWRCLDYQRRIAHAWVAGAQGAVNEAITTSLSAAETAGANGQFAPEVICLQTATQFGDHSTASRLRELATIVEGPRAGLAARLGAGLRDRDGAELAAVSEEFERMGDIVAAVDAAAHAAMAYRRQNLRGSAYACSARAEQLAQQCGGACTLALRQAEERLPLTSREREIVMLIEQGLSNRAIAARLSLSVRTIEGHIYRAMVKTGADSRRELAAMLPRRTPRAHQ
jgi:DNA-binding CsgD family transcriptional regulator